LLLLVDDHPINRMVILKQVNALGYAAQVAEDGVVALDLWSSGRFAAIITDVNMPEMNGYLLARHVRDCEARNGHKRTPIIACTANALGGEAENCFAAGMDDYLSKPVQIPQLAEKLDHWMPIPLAGAASLVAPAREMPIDDAMLAEISSGAGMKAHDILQQFHRYNTQDAASLRQAVQNEDLKQVVHASHRIKGASRTVGAVALASICESLERAGLAQDLAAVSANMCAFDDELERLNAFIRGAE
jgi:CheY-like chemotaxis protein